jgi:polyhydroxybutyrate depolymerase
MTAPTVRGLFARALPALGALAFCALAAGSARAATGRVTIEVNGQKREATIVERARLKRAPRPTIIVLRAAGGGARRAGLSRVDRFLGFDDAAGVGVALAFPSAVGNRWQFDPGKNDDVAMVRALAARLVADGVADRRRIYLAGVSSGGLLALRVLCDGADYLAGAAVLIANAPASVAGACKPAKPIPFMLMAGTADPLMPFQGGDAKLADYKGEVVSADATLALATTANGCGKTRSTEELPDKDVKDGSRVVVEKQAGCKAPVELFRIEGGGHTLPGRPVRADRGAALGARNNDVDTPRLVVDFLRRSAR